MRFFANIRIFFYVLCFLCTGLSAKKDGSSFKGITKYLFPNWIIEYLHDEQILHNKDLFDKSVFKVDIREEYLPENAPIFELPYFLIPENRAEFLKTKTLDKDIWDQITIFENGKTYFKLFVHPESEDYYSFLRSKYKYVSSSETEFLASPTSSFRSLVLLNTRNDHNKPFIVKVSLDKKILGHSRILTDEEIRLSISNQRFLEIIDEKNSVRKSGVDFFPETGGLILKDNEESVTRDFGGQIVRQFSDEIVVKGKKWISFASLMSPRGDVPLIMKVIEKSGFSSIDFIREYLIDKYLSFFKNFILKNGIYDSPHSQNLGFEVTSDFKPTGIFIIKDLADVMPDFAHNLENPLVLKLYNKVTDKYLNKARDRGVISFTYYYKEQVFDLLLKEIAKYDKSLSGWTISKLRGELEEKHLAVLNEHFGFSYSFGFRFKLGVYKDIQKKLMHKVELGEKTMNDFYEKKIEVVNAQRLHPFIREKYLKNKIITYNNLVSEVFYMDNKIFFDENLLLIIKDNRLLAMIILTEEDLERINSTILDSGESLENEYKLNNCKKLFAAI